MNKKVAIANNEPVWNIYGTNTKRHFELTEYMYGCISPVDNSKLTCVGMTGNSMSIDLWKGCPIQCAYCHVQGVKDDINLNDGRMHNISVPRNKYSIDEILNELIEHPFFFENDTIISICTSSTEPFIKGKVMESTFEIMEWFVEHGYKNAFWIVTKVGLPLEAVKRIKKIAETNAVIISICWANNNEEIEKYKKNRFENIELLYEVKNVFINWYMRPLVKEWSTNFYDLEKMFMEVSKYRGIIKAIVPGGLRWTEGIEYGLSEIRNLELPKGISSATRHIKTLSDETFVDIRELAKKYFPGIPVYLHSSCMLSEALKIPNIILCNYFDKHSCDLSSCSKEQRKICGRCIDKSTVHIVSEKVNKILEERGFGINVDILLQGDDVNLITQPKFETLSPAVKQTIINIIAMILKKENEKC